MKSIHTNKAPKAVGPYSQAIQAGNFLFCSGQIGIDPQTGKLVDGIENQTNQVLSNLKAVLEKARLSEKNVVKTTIYLVSMDDYKIVNRLYATFFKSHKPARATVEVAKLPLEALVEIEMVAVNNPDKQLTSE